MAKRMEAADAGNRSAQLALATAYMVGEDGIAKDPVQGIIWYTRAATPRDGEGVDDAWKLGYPLYMLGGCYLDGRGVPEDEIKAQEYFEQSAQAGYPDAMYHQGLKCLKNNNTTEAIRWFRAAAEKLHGEAMKKVFQAACQKR